MHAFQPAHRKATWWLAAIVGFVALLLAVPAAGHAEESNPNNYSCLGSLAAGTAEEGSEEQQVRYSFYCDGPITGYQLQSQVPVTGVQGQPEVTSNATTKPLSDTFSCSGEFPGYALNCVGLAKNGYETVTGQLAIGTKLCREPRVDTLLTVTYAYVEKNVVTQAISGPFDLGRPKGCPPDSFAGWDRLNPQPATKHKKKADKKNGGKKPATKKPATKKK
ncbi:MAG TPA: hypothetical protein VK272_12315 [Solirubrobacteraceae bacterium]|nr:hypothetical protein [Solirubrobacteraceae bacterium]